MAGSAGLLASTLTVGRLRALLGLALPTRLGWSLIGSGAVAAVALSRLWTAADVPRRVRLPLHHVSARQGSGAVLS